MNYRHQYHAGNFADVFKHVLLVQLVRALQKKEKGFLYLDTHAGRGHYDLEAAAQGDSLARTAEWPDGIGRLWLETTQGAAVDDFVSLVRRFDHDRGNRDASPRFYPGSPAIVRALARTQDRLALCEKHPQAFADLAEEFSFTPRSSVHEMDGYVALRAMLPPVERRALVLIDPPFEAQDEFGQVAGALRDGLARLPGGVFAIWYPLTERARVDDFFDALVGMNPPPTLMMEMTVAGPSSPLTMRGCGLAVINPPWQFEQVAGPVLERLGEQLAQGPGGSGRVAWIVPEK